MNINSEYKIDDLLEGVQIKKIYKILLLVTFELLVSVNNVTAEARDSKEKKSNLLSPILTTSTHNPSENYGNHSNLLVCQGKGDAAPLPVDKNNFSSKPSDQPSDPENLDLETDIEKSIREIGGYENKITNDTETDKEDEYEENQGSNVSDQPDADKINKSDYGQSHVPSEEQSVPESKDEDAEAKGVSDKNVNKENPSENNAHHIGQDTHIAELMRNTKFELGLQLDSSDLVGKDKLKSEYRSLINELHDYMNVAEDSRTKENAVISSWAEALYLTGIKRKAIADELIMHYGNQLIYAKQRLQWYESNLIKGKEALSRIQKAIRDSEEAKKIVKIVLEIYDAVEIVENIAHSIAHGSSKIVLAAKLATTITQSEIINENVAKLADYSIQIALATEGHVSIKELIDQINGSVENIDETINDIKSMQRKKSEAEMIYAVPVAGAMR